MDYSFKRPIFQHLSKRLRDKRRFIQVLLGPRQVGKTRLAQEVLQDWSGNSLYQSADEPSIRDRAWLIRQWEEARRKLSGSRAGNFLLVIDEVQKIDGWSETVKGLWDEDSRTKTAIKVLLLGSSSLTLQTGLTESLAGRFETIPVGHWTFSEMRMAFGVSLDDYLFYGGYPGATALIREPERWRDYLLNSLIETTVSRDILLLTRVDRPALLRRLFRLGCDYSAQVLSYQKMLGQLQDKGNATTVAHYLDLLQGAGLIAGIPKYAGRRLRQRSSSPKLLVLNTALMNAMDEGSFAVVRANPVRWGRVVETAVGAHLWNGIQGKNASVSYWLDRNREVDFVLRLGTDLIAIEVKSGRPRGSFPGLAEFVKKYPLKKTLVVGRDGIPLEEFLSRPVESLR